MKQLSKLGEASKPTSGRPGLRSGAQVWHFQNEIGQMDAHYRHELDALVAAKAAVDAEVQKLRTAAAAAVPSLPQPIVPGPLQPALSTFPPPSAPTAVPPSPCLHVDEMKDFQQGDGYTGVAGRRGSAQVG